MAQVTIEIPDELLPQFTDLSSQLPNLITQWLAAENSLSAPAYQEVLTFLMTQPSPAAILAFKVSDITQNRLKTLLAKNQEAALSDRETAELDSYEQLDYLMRILKASAYKTQSSQP
jgi:hypothetical protein